MVTPQEQRLIDQDILHVNDTSAACSHERHADCASRSCECACHSFAFDDAD
jgi:hypothetical protein